VTRIVPVLFVLVPLLLVVPSARAQPRDPTYAEVERSDVEPGASIEIAGGGWQPGTRVEFEMAGRDLGDAGVGENGYFDTIIHIPELAEGEYTLYVRGVSEKNDPFTAPIDMDVSGGVTRFGWAAIAAVSLVVLVILVVVGMLIVRRRSYREGRT
jgi:hypothetical protein